MDDSKKELLKDIFWAMNEVSSRTETNTTTQIVETDDGAGNIVEEEVEVTVTTLYITVTNKTMDEIADVYNFTADQRQQLAELLADENRSMWDSILTGIGILRPHLDTFAKVVCHHQKVAGGKCFSPATF